MRVFYRAGLRGGNRKGDIRIWLPVHCLSAPPDRQLYCTATSHSLKHDQIARNNRLPVQSRRLQSLRHCHPVRCQMMEAFFVPHFVARPPDAISVNLLTRLWERVSLGYPKSSRTFTTLSVATSFGPREAHFLIQCVMHGCITFREVSLASPRGFRAKARG